MTKDQEKKEFELRSNMISKLDTLTDVREKLDGFVDKPLDAALIAEYQRAGSEHDKATEEWLAFLKAPR